MSTTPTRGLGIHGPAVLARQPGEHQPGEQGVHRHAGQDDDHPLPDRLRLEHATPAARRTSGVAALERAAGGLLLRGWPSSRSRRAAASRSRTRSRRRRNESPGIGVPDAEREAVHPDAGPLGGEEVAELVHEDEHAEHDEQGRRVSGSAITTSPRRARARAQRSAARTASSAVAGSDACARRAPRRSCLAIRPNGIRRSRKAATATSLAALNTAGAVPPARPAATPEREGAEDVGPHRLEGQRPRRDRIEPRHAGVGQAVRVRQRVQDGQLHGREARAAPARCRRRTPRTRARCSAGAPPPRCGRTAARRGSAPRSPRAPCWPAWRCPP